MNIRLLALLLVLLVSLSACDFQFTLPTLSSEPSPSPVPSPSPTSIPWPVASRNQSGGVFGLAWDAADSANPLLSHSRYNRDLFPLVYESLFTLDAAFEPQPLLAVGFASVSSLTYSLTVPPNVTFHSGQALTAKDVLYSLQLAKQPNAPYAASLSVVTGARVEGETLVIETSRPCPRLAALLIFPIVSQASATPWDGTGPYVVRSDEERRYLEPNPTWWRHTPLPLQHIELCPVDKLDEMTYLASVGDISLLNTDPNDSYAITFPGDYEIWTYPTLSLYYVGINRSHFLLENAAIRRALSNAFDRTYIASEFFGHAAVPTVLPIPPSSPLAQSIETTPYEYNLRDMADKLEAIGLTDADADGTLDVKKGYARVPFTVRVLAHEQDIVAGRTAVYVAAQLSQMGIEAQANILPLKAYQDALAKGDYELYVGETQISPDFSMSTEPSQSSGTSLLSSDAQAQIWLSTMPFIPLVFKQQAVLTHRGQLQGLQPTSTNLFANLPQWTVHK